MTIAAPTREQLLNLAPGLAAHPDLLLLRGFLAGASGSGKSSTGVVLLEEASRLGVNSAIIAPTDDWYGIGSNADETGPGLDHVQFGGEFGDLPINADMGAAIARMVADGMPVLCVVSGLSLDDRARFVADFCETLLEVNRSPLVLLIDEAHLLAPGRAVGGSKDDDGVNQRSRCREAIVAVVTTGRKPAMIGIWLITQRLARLHTDARELADVSIIHRLRGGNDQKAARPWVEDHLADPAEFNRVGMLDRGEAFIIAPDFDVAGVYQVRPKWTFDSSQSGSVLVGADRRPPKGRSAVDLSAIEKTLGDQLEQAKEEDPDELHKRIRKLEAQLDEARATPAGATKANLEAEYRRGWEAGTADAESKVRAAVAEERQLALSRLIDIQGMARSIDEQTRLHHEQIIEVREAWENAGDDKPGITHDDVLTEASGYTESVGELRQRLSAAQPPVVLGKTWDQAMADPEPEPEPEGPSGEPPPLKPGMIRMIQVLRAYRGVRPEGLTRRELGWLAVVAQGGSMSNYLSAIRAHGLIEDGDGGRVKLTDAGLNATKPAKPFTATEVVDLHRKRLKPGALRMLDLLMRAHPNGLTRKELSGLASVAQGGSLSNYLSSLTKRGLAEVRNRRVYAGAILYLGEGR